MGCSCSEEPIKTLEPMEPIKTLEPMELMFLKQLEQMYIEERESRIPLLLNVSNNLNEGPRLGALPESVKNILNEESEPKLEEEGIVDSVNNKLNEESEQKKGIVESVNNKLNEESEQKKGIVESVNNKLNEESEIKGAVKGVNKNSDEEVNCFC